IYRTKKPRILPQRSEKYAFTLRFFPLLLSLAVILISHSGYGQINQAGSTPTLNNTQNPQDTTRSKTNTNKWTSNDIQIHSTKAWSQLREFPDSSLMFFHRRPFVQPWHRDLGNMGSPARNLLFTPSENIGLSLGYDIFNIYRFHLDELRSEEHTSELQSRENLVCR